ncbi:MAG: lipopolysaccharide biosynthesis protein, partial [Bacilli bacterium]
MRTKKAFKNTFTMIFHKYSVAILAFINTIIFTRVLGQVYNGLNASLNNVFTMIALLELGVGAAITYYLYSPLLTGDKKRAASLVDLYSKVYSMIALLTLLIGIALIPLL